MGSPYFFPKALGTFSLSSWLNLFHSSVEPKSSCWLHTSLRRRNSPPGSFLCFYLLILMSWFVSYPSGYFPSASERWSGLTYNSECTLGMHSHSAKWRVEHWLLVTTVVPVCLSGLAKLQQCGMKEMQGYWPSLTRTQRRGQFFLFFIKSS